MRETEVKLKYHRRDRPALEEFCQRNELSKRAAVTEEDRYYTPVHRDFRKERLALRLRLVTGQDGRCETRLTYKGANRTRGFQDREELETAVADGQVMKEILERLEYTPIAVVEKKRTYYQKGNLTLCIDEVEGLGDYFEVELLGEENAKERLEALLEELPFSPLGREPKTYLELLLQGQTEGTAKK